MQPRLQNEADILSTGVSHARLPALAALACLVASLYSPPAWPAHLEDKIVAVVNSDLIMMSEIKKELAPEEARIRKQSAGEERARRLKMAEYIALTKMIERKLQLQAAKSKGVDISDQEVRQAVEELKRQGEKVDASDPQSATSVKEQLTLMRVVDREVRSGIMVADSEMKRYYQEHKERFAYPEEYQLSQILLKARSSSDMPEIMARAKDILASIRKGGNFEELALQYSEGINASRGGKLGLVRQGELHPAIERAIAPLPVGDISDVIDTSDGLHIIRVDEKKPKQFRPFDEVKIEIQGLVFQQKSEDLYQSWMTDLKNKSYIEVKF
jgi:parvulin-like peptidyl-prolyl isomerase